MPTIPPGFRRVFLALPLSSGTRASLSALVEKISPHFEEARWVPSGNMHITLNFIGEVKATAVDEIIEATKAIPARFPEEMIIFSSLGFFGSPRSPRVLYVRGTSSESLGELASELRRATAHWSKPNDKPFRLHLTLARFRRAPRGLPPSARNEKSLKEMALLNKGRETADASSVFTVDPISSSADRVVLYESNFDEGRVRYSEIESFPLAGNASVSG